MPGTPFDPLRPPPFLTADLPGIGGVIKREPEDFEVEEIPAYSPSGSGDFLYLWIEKRSMGAEYFTRVIARALEISPGEVGVAGLKDRHAITRQMVSVPARAEARLGELETEGLRVLQVSRHGNKLRPGHLRGNRFRILIRDVVPEAGERIDPILDRIRQEGLPNYYGPQRFGNQGETALLGLGMLRKTGIPAPAKPVPAKARPLSRASGSFQSLPVPPRRRRFVADGDCRRRDGQVAGRRNFRRQRPRPRASKVSRAGNNSHRANIRAENVCSCKRCCGKRKKSSRGR